MSDPAPMIVYDGRTPIGAAPIETSIECEVPHIVARAINLQ